MHELPEDRRGAFGTAVTIITASFAFVKDEPARAEWISEAGSTRWGWYCDGCGSRIANGMTPPTRVLSLRAGTLDDTSWVEPVGDIWTRSAQPWVRFVEGGIRTEKQPTDYSDFMAKFRAQGRFAV